MPFNFSGLITLKVINIEVGILILFVGSPGISKLDHTA